MTLGPPGMVPNSCCQAHMACYRCFRAIVHKSIRLLLCVPTSPLHYFSATEQDQFQCTVSPLCSGKATRPHPLGCLPQFSAVRLRWTVLLSLRLLPSSLDPDPLLSQGPFAVHLPGNTRRPAMKCRRQSRAPGHGNAHQCLHLYKGIRIDLLNSPGPSQCRACICALCTWNTYAIRGIGCFPGRSSLGWNTMGGQIQSNVLYKDRRSQHSPNHRP